MSASDAGEPLDAVPLFPLPNVVLFPRAVLPLHIFEERYKQMTAEALAGRRRVAMALLRPGWEKDYYQRPAIEPVVCVGRIVSWERLEDGRYNYLLQGEARARIVGETPGGAYRVAALTLLEGSAVLELDLEPERRRMIALFEGPLGHTSSGRAFRQLVAGPLPCADLADLLAFSYLEDVQLKQSLLADVDVIRRVRRVLEAVEPLGRRMHSGLKGYPADPSVN